MGWKFLCCAVNQESSKKRPPITAETILDISRCNLIEIPNCEFDQDPEALQEIDLSYNKIEELDPILMRCRNVRILNLSDNQLRMINDQLSTAFKNLRSLNLAHNRFESIPTLVGTFEYLQSLDLSNNPIGKILDGTITEVLTLKELRLNSCGLNFLPANIAKLVNLESLELRENNLETLPVTIKLLTKLKLLDIGRNNLEVLQVEIGYLFNLQELILDENILTEIAVVGDLLNLRHLDISANTLMSFPEEICNCSMLETLYGDGNEFEQLPESIGNLTQLTRLNMNYVALKALPNSIGYLQALEELNILENYIESLPSTIGFLRNLQVFVAYDNRLKELPNELASCTSLTHLNVANNRLEALPDNIGYLKNLRSLNLIGNYLMYLPISLGMISNLEGLWLSPYQRTRRPNLERVEYENGIVLSSPLLEQNYKPGGEGEQPESFVSTRSQTKIHFEVINGNDEADTQKTDEGHPQLKSPEQPHIFRIPTPTQRERKRLEKFAKSINAERKEKSFEIKEAIVASTSPSSSTATYTNTPRQRRSLDPEYIELSSSEFRPLSRPPPYEIASKYSKMSQSELENFQKMSNNNNSSYAVSGHIPLLSSGLKNETVQ